MKARSLVTFLLLLISGYCFADKFREITVINSAHDEFLIKVEVADNYSTRSEGLMYRTSMPESTGLLMIFPVKGEAAVWMRNTFIPLDILFLSESGHVQKIVEYARPNALEVYKGTTETLAVLELNAGDVEKLKIDLSSKIIY